jgi:hypothetical protein
MKRFEKMAEENRRRKDEQRINFIIEETERITVTSESKRKEGATKTS